MYFQRAARTDKSVSAIRQIVSLKILESISQRYTEVNKLLPDDIRIMGCKRATQSFDAKNYCDGRTYAYLMPSLALNSHTDEIKEDFRVGKDVIERFNSILEGYIGTHLFHNFTSGVSAKEACASRVIKTISCSDPFFPCEQNDLEFVLIRIRGQSFMLHQIRKMIGLAIAVVRGLATEEHIEKSMEPPFMDVPKAPGLGLVLEEVHYDRYNRKYGGDGHHEPLKWDAENDAIEKFKQEHIYPVIVETERSDKSMINWLPTLDLHSFSSSEKRLKTC